VHYAAGRAGSDREFSFGDDEADLGKYAWFDGNSEDRTHPVATKRPNRWGLSDLHGNAWEWCEDTDHDTYDEAPTDGSPWVDEGSPFRVCRGGGLGIGAESCRSANRFRYPPAGRIRFLGFRPAFVPSKD